MEQILGDSPIFRTMDVSKPAESALLKETMESRPTEDRGVRHEVRPFDGQNTPQVSQMECVESLFLSGVNVQ